MQVTFLRFHGQDSAYVFIGKPLDAYRAAMQNPAVTAEEFDNEVTAGEVSFAETVAVQGELLSVGYLI